MYSRTNGTFYGTLKILDNSSISISGEQIDLFGGSNKYQWASEDGNITAEMSLKVGQFEDWMVELFLGKAPTATTAETSGNVTSLTNVYGTTALSATIGVASVAVIPTTGAANLKFGKYILKVISATTVKLYCSSDADLNRGTDVAYDDDNLSVTAAALTITSGANTDIAGLGLRLAGGSGTIGMTTGDTAEFYVRPVNSKASVVVVGGSADVAPEFGAILMAQVRSSGELFEIEAYRCKANGMPIGFETKAWNKPEVKAKLLYDSAKNAVFAIRAVAI